MNTLFYKHTNISDLVDTDTSKPKKPHWARYSFSIDLDQISELVSRSLYLTGYDQVYRSHTLNESAVSHVQTPQATVVNNVEVAALAPPHHTANASETSGSTGLPPPVANQSETTAQAPPDIVGVVPPTNTTSTKVIPTNTTLTKVIPTSTNGRR